MRGIERPGVALVGALLATLVACGRTKQEATCTDVEACKSVLRQRSDDEARKLAEADCSEDRPTRAIAIIGDGIAGTAVALNLTKNQRVRVYGSPSFWTTLQDLPNIWQTNLTKVFADAGFIPPDRGTGPRIARPSIIAVNLEGLVKADAAYLGTGPVTVAPGTHGTWTVIDSEGRSETITGSLIIGTGVLRPLRITDQIPGRPGRPTEEVRRALVQDKKLLTGDAFLADSSVAKGKVVGILGDGGSAADCVISALSNGANSVVVWGKLMRSPLIGTIAFDDLVKTYGPKICRVHQLVKHVAYDGKITVNREAVVTCANADRLGKPAPQVDLLVESLGRYQGDPPAGVVSAANRRAIIYHPIIDGGALIAVKVGFGSRTGEADATEESPALYLIGASATWIPPEVVITPADLQLYNAGLKQTVTLVNQSLSTAAAPTSSGLESGPPSFAVAAFMGSHLARYLDH